MTNEDYNDIERIFKLDCHEKKRNGRGIYNRVSRRGYIKHFRMPSDFLSRKERKNLNGKVVTYNMYDYLKDPKNIPTLNELLKKDANEVKGILTFLKSNYTNSVVQKSLKVSSGKLYKLFDLYGIPYNKKGPSLPKHLGKKINKKLNNEIEVTINDEKDKIIEDLNKTITELKNQITHNEREKDKFVVTINDVLGKDELSSKLLGLVDILSSDKEYDVNFILKEK